MTPHKDPYGLIIFANAGRISGILEYKPLEDYLQTDFLGS
jgi:hypothetical protein